MMKVLHLTASDARRGAERRALDLAEALRQIGTPGEIRAVSASHRADSLPIKPLPGGRFDPRSLLELRRLMSQTDVLIAYGSSSLPAAALASIGTHIPFIYRGIGDPLYWSNTPTRRLRSSLWLRRAARVVVLWSGAAESLTASFGVPASKIQVLPNGVDARPFPLATPESSRAARRQFGLEGTGQVLACVGSLSPEKRVDRAIEVVGQLDDVTLVIAGDGPERQNLAMRASALPTDKVRFLGSVGKPADVYAASDALLLTSDTEGLPGVIIEGGFCGRPTIATRVGGVCEAVIDRRTGATAAPEDLQGLVAAARFVLSDVVGLGAAARRHCLERFEVGVVARLWENLLRTVVYEERAAS